MNALVKRSNYTSGLGWEDEWARWPPVTPEKTPAKTKSKVKRGELPRKSDGLLCRLICIMACERIFALYLDSNKPPTRDQQDRGAVDGSHAFHTAAAEAMIDYDFKTVNGNSIALISDHKSDRNPEAPEELFPLLDGLDLHTSAIILEQSLNRDDSGVYELRPLEEMIKSWLADIRQEYTVSANFESCWYDIGQSCVDAVGADSCRYLGIIASVSTGVSGVVLILKSHLHSAA